MIKERTTGARARGRHKILLPTALLVAASLAMPARAMAQQSLTFADGDQITGQLVDVVDGSWVFSYKGVEVTIPAGEVQTFRNPENAISGKVTICGGLLLTEPK